MTTIPIKKTAFDLGYGATSAEDLGITPQQLQADLNRPGYYLDGVYQLSFTVENIDPSYPGYFEAGIDFGTQELGSIDGWGVRTPVQITMVCPGPGYIVIDQALPSGGPVQGANNLVIHFTVPGWALSFKGVALAFTPVN